MKNPLTRLWDYLTDPIDIDEHVRFVDELINYDFWHPLNPDDSATYPDDRDDVLLDCAAPISFCIAWYDCEDEVWRFTNDQVFNIKTVNPVRWAYTEDIFKYRAMLKYRATEDLEKHFKWREQLRLSAINTELTLLQKHWACLKGCFRGILGKR